MTIDELGWALSVWVCVVIIIMVFMGGVSLND